MKKRWPLVLLMAWLLPGVAYSDAVSEGQLAFKHGHFEQAVQHWETALKQLAPLNNQTTQYIDTAVQLSAAYQALGVPHLAKDILQNAKKRADQIGDPVRQANVLSQLADCMIMGGDVHEAVDENGQSGRGGVCRVKDSSSRWQKAQYFLDKAEALARQTDDTLLLANILNRQGNLWMLREDHLDAFKKTLIKYKPCLKQKAEVSILRAQTAGKQIDFTDEELQCIKDKATAEEETYPQCIVFKPIKDKILTNKALQCIAMAKAIEKYEQSLDKLADDQALKATVWLNLAQAKIKSENYGQAKPAIKTALKQVQMLPNSLEKAFGLINIAQTLQDLPKPPKAPTMAETITPNVELLDILRGVPFEETAADFTPPSLGTFPEAPRFSPAQLKQFRYQSYQALNKARQIAQTKQDDQTLAYVNGYLAQLYADEKRYDEAIQLTRQAIFYAQQNSLYSELLYRWERQLGDLFKKQGDLFEEPEKIDAATDAAIAAYQRAIGYLQNMGPILPSGYRVSQPFRDKEPIYFNLADLLLHKAAKTTTKTKQHLLKAARDQLDLLNVAELQSYLGCTIELQKIDHVLPPKTAAVYPIILPDRIELLVNMRGGIQQESIDLLSDEHLRHVVRLFQTKLQAVRDIKPQAQQLYKWFINPIKQTLSNQGIDTLIIVPTGILRTIPFAALYDAKNEQYLIEQYAVAVTPGLKLTGPIQALKRDKIKALLVGLSESVDEDLPELDHVEQELDEIEDLIGSSGKVLKLKNEEFSIENLETALNNTPYSIVHFATHGHFDSDPSKTFLLAYGGRLKMNRLRDLVGISEFRDQPVELLTLSACETAWGDDKAALGLAGVALQAGARSVLATLWSVDDVATKTLVTKFYEYLKNKDLSKAQALQKAQLHYLLQQNLQQNQVRSHPFFWAAFLLIGNWL